MSEPLTQCKNTRYPHTVGHPSYAARYQGYCLECSNAGIGEFQEEIDRLREELRRLREAASVAVKFMEPTGAQLAAVYGHDLGCICDKCEHVDQARIAREQLKTAVLPAREG